MDFAFDSTTGRAEGEAGALLRGAHPPLPSRSSSQQIPRQREPWDTPPVMEELKAKARAEGLWNLFLPDPRTAPA